MLVRLDNADVVSRDCSEIGNEDVGENAKNWQSKVRIEEMGGNKE